MPKPRTNATPTEHCVVPCALPHPHNPSLKWVMPHEYNFAADFPPLRKYYKNCSTPQGLGWPLFSLCCQIRLFEQLATSSDTGCADSSVCIRRANAAVLMCCFMAIEQCLQNLVMQYSSKVEQQTSISRWPFAGISCICRKIFECNNQESSLASCNQPRGVQMNPVYPLHQVTNLSAPADDFSIALLGPAVCLLCASGKCYLFKQGGRSCPGGSSGSLSYTPSRGQGFSLGPTCICIVSSPPASLPLSYNPVCLDVLHG